MRDMEVLKDPETSDWLRHALQAALQCDPVRVANDVEILRAVLQQRVADLDDPVRFPRPVTSAA